jgi:hypothetical protein
MRSALESGHCLWPPGNMLATSIAPLGSIVIARAAPIDSFFVVRNRFQNSGIGSIAFQGNCPAHRCKTGKDR